jgi:hypothetical protein
MSRLNIQTALKSLLFGFTFLVFCFVELKAQEVEVNAKIDTNRILIGDQINYYLEILQSENAKVLYPDLEKQFPREIEIIESGKPDTTFLEDENRLRIRQKIRVTSFDTGKVIIPSLSFRYQYGNQLDSLRTFPKSLIVQSVNVDTTKTIFDIKGPFGAPITFRELLPYIGGFLGLVILGLAIFYFLRYRKKKQSEEEQVTKPKEPAHIIALRELDKLKEEKLWQKGDIKLFYTRLTDILRNYLWLRYDIKTLERTTDEILQSLRNTGFDNEELFKKLEDTLHEADLVKFAKWHPESTENEKNLEMAYEFVNKTKFEEKLRDEEQKPKEQNINIEKNS